MARATSIVNWLVPVALVAGGWTGAWGVIMEAPGYTAESMTTYALPFASAPTAMTFASDGQLYVSHNSSALSTNNGAVYRVDSSWNASRWVTGLVRPEHMAWGGGTTYGNHLYVVEGYKTPYTRYDGQVTRVSLSGQKTPFCTEWLDQPVSIGFDRSGNYGGSMFVGLGDSDGIMWVDTSGHTSWLKYFGESGSGSPIDIEIESDPQGRFGGHMYVATWYDQPHLTGILRFDSDGSFTRVLEGISGARDLAFDESSAQLFGGDMYVFGTLQGEANYKLYRITPEGDITLFARGLSYYTAMTFGPDGALYLAELKSGNVAEITRIIPEPATLLVLGLGGLALVRRRRRRA